MKLLLQFSQSPVFEILWKWSVLLALGWTTHGLLRSRDARWRLILWRGVFCIGLALPVIQFLPLPAFQIPVHDSTKSVSAAPVASASGIAALPNGIEPSTAAPAEAAATDGAAVDVVRRPAANVASAISLNRILITIWAVGAICGAIRLVRRMVRLSTLKKNAIPAGPEIAGLARDIVRRLRVRRSALVLISDSTVSPFAFGVIQPAIMLPGKLAQSLSASEIAALLGHEIAHLRQNDLFWCVGWRWMEVIFWFHPLAWKVPAAHSLACEQEADRIAASQMEDHAAYAQILARLALRVLPIPELETQFTANGAAQISRRLRQLEQGWGAWKPKHSLAAFGLVLALALASAGCKLTGSQAAAHVVPSEIGKAETDHGRSDQQRPGKEEAYTITSVMQLLQPVNPAQMNDDFQEARVLAQDNDSCTVELTYYPFYRPAIGENPNWRKDNAAMAEYLRPTTTENWDETMQRDLMAELHQAGIDPEQLTDKQVVEQVSRWAMKRAHSTQAFAIWAVDYPEGKPAVYPPLREAFDGQKPEKSWTDQQMFEQEVLGRSMFYNKVHGSCTSSSIYLATILRALGIPTRIVFCIPPFDPNDDAQAKMFYDNVHHNQARETVRAALDGAKGFCNHLFNEVYVGRRWVRLNYNNLGQPILDSRYFGLLTHIYTCSDLSKVPLAQTWGMRYFQYPAGQPKLSSVNPYRLISVQDHFGANAQVDNPPVPPAELRTATITGLYRLDSPDLPRWVADSLAHGDGGSDFLITFKEWVPGSYMQMRAFEKRVGREFLLTAPQCPSLRAQLSGLKLSRGDGSYQAFGARLAREDKARLAPGVAYNIEPVNISDIYRWAVSPDAKLLPLKAASESSANVSATLTGGNKALFEYLGDPVQPPPDMDPAYKKEGLTQAIQSAAGKAGIALGKIEIEDSEFPFLVGVVFKRGDFPKLKDQICKLPGYAWQGGVDSDALAVINIVPLRTIPSETCKRIGRRTLLREQIFYDRLRVQK